MENFLDALEAFARRPKIITLAAIICVFLVFVQGWFGLFSQDTIIDSYSYYFAAQAINSGLNPYDDEQLVSLGHESGIKGVEPYLYPPLLAGVWRGFMFLSPHGAHRVFMIFNALLLGLALYLLAKIIQPVRHPHALLLLFILFQPLNGPAVTSLRIGQINIVLLVLMLLALYYHLQSSDALSALSLCLAILIKLTPALLLIYFIFFYRRRWSYVSWSIFWAIILVDATFLLAPPATWLQFLHSSSAGLPHKAEFSIWGWLQIHALTNQFIAQYKVIFYFLVSLPLLFMAIISIRNRPEEERPIYSFSLLLMLSLLLSPLTWHHHYLFYLLPGFYLLSYHWGKSHLLRTTIYLSLAIAILIRLPGTYHMIRPLGTLVAIILSLDLIPAPESRKTLLTPR